MNFLAAALYLSAAQANYAAISYNLGAQYDEGYTFSAIIWEESSYCQNKINGWSRGCGGLKRKTARIFDPDVTRQELTDDDERNLHDSLLYLLECKRQTHSWRSMVYAYHHGIPAALGARKEELETDSYTNAISVKVKQLEAIALSED